MIEHPVYLYMFEQWMEIALNRLHTCDDIGIQVYLYSRGIIHTPTSLGDLPEIRPVPNPNAKDRPGYARFVSYYITSHPRMANLCVESEARRTHRYAKDGLRIALTSGRSPRLGCATRYFAPPCSLLDYSTSRHIPPPRTTFSYPTLAHATLQDT